MEKLIKIPAVYLFMLMTASLMAQAASAKDSPVFKLAGTFGEEVKDWVVKGDYAFYAQGAEVRIADVSAPANPKPAGAILLGKPVSQLMSHKAALYVVCNTAEESWLQIFDISNPRHPRSKRTVSFKDPGAIRIEKHEQLLWVIEGTYHQGIQSAYDITDPLSPIQAKMVQSELIFDLFNPGSGEKACRQGHLAYVNKIFEIRVMDLSTSPATQKASLKFNDSIQDITARGPVLYAITSSDDQANLHIIDIRDPKQPREKKVLAKDFRESFDARHAAMLIIKSHLWIWSGGRYPHLAVIYDISDPFQPKKLEEKKPAPGKTATAHNKDRITSHPAWMAEVKNIRDIQVSGRIAYLADAEFGVRVLDISDPAQSRLVGGIKNDGGANHLALSGSTLCVAGSEPNLTLIDISKPRAPATRGSVALPAPANSLFISSHTLYAAGGMAGVLAVDIVDPDAPRLLSTYEIPGVCRDVVCDGHFAAAAAGKVYILNVADPSHPVTVTDFNPGLSSDRLFFHGHDLIVCGQSGNDSNPDDDAAIKYVCVDLTNPSAPQVKTKPWKLGGKNEAIGGRWAASSTNERTGQYGIYDEGTIRVYDLSHPEKPMLRDTINPPKGPRKVFIRGEWMFASEYETGLMIYRQDFEDSLLILGKKRQPTN